MKFFANRNTLVVLLFLAIASAICLPVQAQFGPRPVELRLQDLEKQVQLLGKFMVDLKKSSLADMQNPQVSTFQLKYIRASSAANTVSKLLGQEGYRLAFEETTNQLIVSAPAEISKTIGELLQKIDGAPVQENEKIVTSQKQSAPKSLQVHIFWLADNKSYNSNTERRIPLKVVNALRGIGITNPGIVAQSTTSLFAKDVSLSESFMHATFKNQEFLFTNNVQLRLKNEKQIELVVQTQILKSSEKENACELRGSLAAPLGHYMVLGTTNYVAKKTEVEKALDTSRFAFVIQVVEADSYAPDE